jgi:hypothetical protein
LPFHWQKQLVATLDVTAKIAAISRPAQRGTTQDITALRSMPRYHFDLVDHTTVEDKGGQILADDIVASDVADELALRVYEVRPELRGKGYSILVTNADGDTIHSAPLEDALGSSRPARSQN